MDKEKFKNKITLIYSYYLNPNMFKLQQENWNRYPQWVKDRIEIIVVDDASPYDFAENNITEKSFGKNHCFDMRLFRIKEDFAWNWAATRNIAAHHAKYPWLFITDMDLMIPEKTIVSLLKMLDENTADSHRYYTFDRVDAPNMTPYKNHPNTYFMSKKLYWEIGGFDEEFTLLTGGIYGLDAIFRKWLDKLSDGGIHLHKLNIIRYTREVVPDASSLLARKEGRDDKLLKEMRKLAMEKLKGKGKILSLKFLYQEIEI